jgi:DnaK suppressor protein
VRSVAGRRPRRADAAPRQAGAARGRVARLALAGDTAPMSIDRNRIRDTLQALEAELADPADGVERAPDELDQQCVGRVSRMDSIQVRAMALATEQRRKAELARVKAALERLDGDEFGYCEMCGEKIAPARLEHNPAVTTCISCAR